MYLDGTHQNTCKIHAGYIQDTSGYVLYRKHPPICMETPRHPSSTLQCSSLWKSVSAVCNCKTAETSSPVQRQSPVSSLCESQYVPELIPNN